MGGVTAQTGGKVDLEAAGNSSHRGGVRDPFLLCDCDTEDEYQRREVYSGHVAH